MRVVPRNKGYFENDFTLFRARLFSTSTDVAQLSPAIQKYPDALGVSFLNKTCGEVWKTTQCLEHLRRSRFV